MKKIDLHVHTHFSDGMHSTEEVFEMAKNAGIHTIAVTDHNWPHHIANNAKIAKDFDLQYIEGIEISSLFEEKTAHILGYSKHFDLDKLGKGLEKQIEGLNERSKQIVDNINNSGDAKISFQQMKNNFKGCIQNFPVQIELGKALGLEPLGKKAKEIYKKHTVEYGDWFMGPADAVKLIHKSKGAAVWAHPALFLNRNGKDKFDKLFSLLIEAGIDGLEASHSGQSESEEKEIIRLAEKYNLLVTGGSDFHGLEVHPGRQLGRSGLNKAQFTKVIKKLDSV